MDIYQFDSTSFQPDLLTDLDIKKQQELLNEYVWYHGLTGREEAENRILNNGEFLVRFSQEPDLKFAVSTKWNGKFMHTIIKNEINHNKKQLDFYINEKFKFSTILELILFHKENQYPLSENSGAVLYKPIDINHVRSGFLNGQRESKFRKSTNMFKKHTEKRSIPRSGSETYLTYNRFSGNVPGLNKSLTNLSKHDLDAPNKPKKPSFKLLNSKHLLLKLRPSNIKIRNRKLYKESSDYTDYCQVKDTEDAMKREEMRRGFSLENRSPSLFGLNTMKKEKKQKKHSMDQSMYVTCNSSQNGFFSTYSEQDDRDSTITLTANTPVVANPSPMSTKFDVYGFDRVNSVIEVVSPKRKVPKYLGLSNFINLALGSHPMPCCGPVESAFDKQAINKVATYLLANDINHLIFTKHLQNELLRIFELASAGFTTWNMGYRTIFLPGSDLFQRDLLIRQTALAHFIMATIISTTSTEKRINLIFYWIRCANHLLTHIKDMFHFRAIFSAIFSEQILSLRVWKIVYRQDPSAKLLMESLKEAIKKGCLLRTDIDQCIPDFVHLWNAFSGNEDLDVVWKISQDIVMWSDQAFSSPSTWLQKTTQAAQSNTALAFYREVVQSESLLCMILGRNSINHVDMTPLLEKVSDCIKLMAKVVNETNV